MKKKQEKSVEICLVYLIFKDFTLWTEAGFSVNHEVSLRGNSLNGLLDDS